MSEPLTTPVTPELIKQKLAAFERLHGEFEASFRFVQDVHGQQRFTLFPVANSVRYLHALWVCECKDRLLSIYKNIKRYEGSYCLELLRRWQEGDTAGVGVLIRPADQHGERSWRVLEPTESPGPFAEHRMSGYVALLLPNHNNVTRLRFVDPPDRSS